MPIILSFASRIIGVSDIYIKIMAKKEESKSLLENAEVIEEKLEGFEHWVAKNPKLIIGVLVALLAVAGGYFGFNYYKKSQNAEAQKEMFQAQRYFEADSLNLALNGDGNNLGMLQIIDNYGMSEAANLANFYTGYIYLKQGKFALAVFHLKEFKASDLLVQARAFSLIGDAYMEQKDFENAASYYDKASNYKPNKEFTPTYLMKAALAYEKLNKSQKAIEAYQTIIDKFGDSAEVQNAKKLKAKLEVNS